MEENTNWTTIDAYYKGFHVKKSIPENKTPTAIKETINGLIEEGFEPSWNSETSEQHLDPVNKIDKAYGIKKVSQDECQHPESDLEVKVAGPNAKRPGSKYVTCKLCGKFIRYA